MMPNLDDIFGSTELLSVGKIRKYLKERGYAGLYNPACGCGCPLTDFAPCDGISGGCEAAYVWPGGGEYDGFLAPGSLGAVLDAVACIEADIEEAICNSEVALDRVRSAFDNLELLRRTLEKWSRNLA
jgi:hypothetical protein